jgi:hypothetical protein
LTCFVSPEASAAQTFSIRPAIAMYLMSLS